MMNYHDKQDESLIYELIKQNIVKCNMASILSLGCGDCVIEKKLAEEYPNITFYCIDKIAPPQIQNSNLIYIQADVSLYEFKSLNVKFEYIYSFSLLQYLNIDCINNINVKLFKILDNKGILVHFDIPNKKKKLLYRINIIKNTKCCIFKTLFGKRDFLDSESSWINLKKIKLLNNSSMFIKNSRIHFEREDLYVKHN